MDWTLFDENMQPVASTIASWKEEGLHWTDGSVELFDDEAARFYVYNASPNERLPLWTAPLPGELGWHYHTLPATVNEAVKQSSHSTTQVIPLSGEVGGDHFLSGKTGYLEFGIRAMTSVPCSGLPGVVFNDPSAC